MVMTRKLNVEARRRILEAAHDLFLERGLKGASMEEVASADAPPATSGRSWSLVPRRKRSSPSSKAPSSSPKPAVGPIRWKAPSEWPWPISRDSEPSFRGDNVRNHLDEDSNRRPAQAGARGRQGAPSSLSRHRLLHRLLPRAPVAGASLLGGAAGVVVLLRRNGGVDGARVRRPSLRAARPLSGGTGAGALV